MITLASKNHSSIALEAYKKIQEFDIDNVTVKWNESIIQFNHINLVMSYVIILTKGFISAYSISFYYHY